jgi:hypothetical protein
MAFDGAKLGLAEHHGATGPATDGKAEETEELCGEAMKPIMQSHETVDLAGVRSA